MARVIDNARSYPEHPRPITVIYEQLVHEYVISATGNIPLLHATAFLTGRRLRYRLRDRPFLQPFLVEILTSPGVPARRWRR